MMAATHRVPPPITCPKCQNDDPTLMSRIPGQTPHFQCEVCSKDFYVRKEP